MKTKTFLWFCSLNSSSFFIFCIIREWEGTLLVWGILTSALHYRDCDCDIFSLSCFINLTRLTRVPPAGGDRGGREITELSSNYFSRASTPRWGRKRKSKVLHHFSTKQPVIINFKYFTHPRHSKSDQLEDLITYFSKKHWIKLAEKEKYSER